jgi:hypothetical protein
VHFFSNLFSFLPNIFLSTLFANTPNMYCIL